MKSSHEWVVTGQSGDQRVLIDGSLITNNGNATCSAAINGLDITYIPTLISGDAIRSRALEVILPDYPCIEPGIHAIYPSNRHLSAKVRAFIDILLEEISDPPGWDRGIFTAGK